MIGSAQALTLTPGQRQALLDVVDRQFGIRGSDYGAARIDDAVSRVLPTTAWQTVDELLASATAAPGLPLWLAAVVEHLTVGETYFLRDPAQIAALRETILPDLLLRRATDQRLRIWSAGCSTGEEPYTVAILLREKHLSPAWDLLLVGTDVNRQSLRVAREARYPAWSFRATPDDVRERYFEPAHNGWRVIEPIRRMARFAWTNLGAEELLPPSADLDLIMCRNVTIYFDEAATQRLYQALVRALAPGGWLMLGPSDPLPADRQWLERIEIGDAVLWRRAVPASPASRPTSYPTASPRSSTRPPSGAQRVSGGQAGSTRPPSWPRAALATLPAASGPTDLPPVSPNEATAAAAAGADLEGGLLALESGAVAEALEWLRRATFRDPLNPLGQFALARAYLDSGDPEHAHAALVQSRRLLARMAADEHVPGADALQVETLRQAIQTHLGAIAP